MFYVDIGQWINHTVKWNLTLAADTYISILVCKTLNSNEKDRYAWNKSIKWSQISLSMFLCTVTVTSLSFFCVQRLHVEVHIIIWCFSFTQFKKNICLLQRSFKTVLLYKKAECMFLHLLYFVVWVFIKKKKKPTTSLSLLWWLDC